MKLLKKLTGKGRIGAALATLTSTVIILADSSGSGSGCPSGMQNCCLPVTSNGVTLYFCKCCASPQYSCMLAFYNNGNIEVVCTAP